MRKTVVIYQSKYGYTERYAQWIAQALSCDILERNRADARALEQYEVIVYGGGIYAESISGVDLLTKNFEKLRDKKLVLFTCGLSNPESPESAARIDAGLDKNLNPELRKMMKTFHLRGGMNYAKLSFVHKAMLSMFSKMLSKQSEAEQTQEQRDMLRACKETVDFTNEAAIQPLVAYVKEL